MFVLCGLWHGANWTFLVWGLIHGTFLALERGRFGDLLARCPRPARHAYTLLVVVVAWVFFRSDTVDGALHYAGALFGIGAGSDQGLLAEILDRKTIVLMAAAAAGSTPILSVLSRDWRARAGLAPGAGVPAAAMLMRPVAIGAILLLSAAFLAGASYNPFIYFRF